ncbi:MAG: serine/threonine dehydratase [Proteobacteria bacterium]|nr:serine/threonine dehydratase [Pseudomonadota bacterium]
MTPIDPADIFGAIARIKTRIHRTPVVSSTNLNKWLGHEVLFKAECLQKVGAFKARGALNAVLWRLEHDPHPSHLIANSSGNHAQAVAWAGAQVGLPVSVYMPREASPAKARATRHYGAKVALLGSRAEVDRVTEQRAREPGMFWVPPYNHEQVVAGQGTAMLEALLQIGQVDAAFAPCGGGGLCAGTLIAARAWSAAVRVYAAEPLNANDAAESVRKGSIQRLARSPTTLADGARTLSVGEVTFPYLRRLDGIYEVEEEPIAYWTQWLAHLLKLRIEPTGAMAMEAALRWLRNESEPRKVLVILSGGNIDASTARKIWQQDHLSQRPTL